MGQPISNRAIFQAMGIYALLFAFGVFLYRSPGFFGRHGHDSLRPGMTVAEVLRETRGRYAAYAGPETDREGKRGFSIRTYGIVRDDAERGETTGGLRTPDDLPGRVEDEMKKEPGSWDIVFWYHTMDRGSDTYFTVTFGPDLRVGKVGEVGKTRDGHF
jgi:hypothetical protein